MPSFPVPGSTIQGVGISPASPTSAWCPLSDIVCGIVRRIEVEAAVGASQLCDLPKAA